MLEWIDARFPLLSTWKSHVSEYYVPKNLNVLYLLGSLALLLLLNQCVTGLWLTMFYTPTAKEAFDSIEYIMRDVNYGWLFRYMHTTGASAFFIVIYLHMFRGLLYGSYQKPRELVWLLGMGLFVLLIAEAFCGYLLPWGQMSYWGAQVITSLIEAIPFVGESLVLWLRGDYQVSSATLQRFFALHVIGIPLLLLGFVYLHVVALHKVGSNNPEGIDIKKHVDAFGNPLDGIPMHPFYTMKDMVGAVAFLMVFFAIVFFAPEFGGYFLEKTNAVPANPLLTPELITPAWYMTPFYSILRAIPNKLLGISAVSFAFICPFLLPWWDNSPVKSMRYKGYISQVALALLVISVLMLGYLGTLPLTPVRQWLARGFVCVYFSYFVFMPLYTKLEKYRIPPDRIPS